MKRSIFILLSLSMVLTAANAQLASTSNTISLGKIDMRESQSIKIPILNQSREELTLQYIVPGGNSGIIGGPQTLESYERDVITKSLTARTTNGKMRSKLVFKSSDGNVTVKIKARVNNANDPSCYRFDQKQVRVKTSGKYISGSTDSELVRVYSRKDKNTLYSTDPEKVPYAHLVVLVDASGSMGSNGKMNEMKSSLYDLIDELRPTDKISILRYSEGTEVLADGVSCHDKEALKDIVYKIEAGGFTNGKEGIESAMQHSMEKQMAGYSNNIIMLTDGEFNLGQDQEGIRRYLLGQNRSLEYRLSVLTIGSNPQNEKEMKELSKSGNGYFFNLTEDSNNKANRNKILIKQLSS